MGRLRRPALLDWRVDWVMADKRQDQCEYFFQKFLLIRPSGWTGEAMFVQPESLKQDLNMDYGGFIDKVPPPGAEGEDVGNGKADQYFLTDTNAPKVPVDSKLTEEERDIKKEAVNPKNGKENKPDSADDKKKDKKKGFFRRLFGKKDKE